MATPQTLLSPLQLITPVLPPGTATMSVDSTVLPVTVLADAKTTRIELSLYNTTTPITAYTTSPHGNTFTTSVAIDQTVLEATIQLIGRNYDPTATWNPLTAYAVGYRYADTNGNVQVAVRAGASGALVPSWFTNTPAMITNVQLSTNTLTITCPGNTLVPGQQVYLAGLTNATFLNESVFTVVTAVGSAFTATYIHADYLSAADTGIVYCVTVDSGVLWANYGVVAITPTIKFALLAYESSLAVAIAPPSGILAKMNQTDCILQWVTPDYPGFIGVRIMISTDRAGINPPYIQYGDLVTTVSSTEQTIINTTTNTAVNVPVASITNISIDDVGNLTVTAVNTFVPGTVVTLTELINATFLNDEVVTVVESDGSSFKAKVTFPRYPSAADSGTATSTISTNTVTSVQTVMATNFSSVDIPSSLINQSEFYALFSTVIQEPGTNVLYESVQNGPLTCGFVNLKVVSPTDFIALQRKEDIAGRLIGQIVRQIPTLDLSPHSEIRDIFIDPFSIECANMSVREWFARVSTSVSAISQIDDTTGTGVSDPFQSSPYKQQIARAYGLSPQDTQTLIDNQFDILGEQAGLTRLVATQSTVVLTFYTYQQPQASITIPQGATVATVADATTPALSFVTQGQATINISNLSSFYNPQYGWWSVSVPAQCSTMGSNGNVGAGTIRQVVSGMPSGLNVTNLVPAAYGTDEESNSRFAARIQAHLVTGVDTGTRHGYFDAALGTPGIIGAQIVAAGDLEMIRDWDPIRQKHVFGCVDIYTRGTTLSQQDEIAFFTYQNTGTYGQTSTYLPLIPVSGLKFQITGFFGLPYPLYDAAEIAVTRLGSTFYLGTERAQFDNVNGDVILNSNDMAYQYAGSTVTRTKIPLLLNGTPATNQVAVAALAGATGGTYTLAMYARYKSPFTLVPALQPVLDVYSIVGQSNLTGVVPSSAIELIHTSDFLLDGGSNDAGDTVQVTISSLPTQATVTIPSSGSVTIDTGMDVPLDSNGNPIDVLSVRSMDLSTLYKAGTDYRIVPVADLTLGTYHTYGLQTLSSSVAVTAVNVTSNMVTITANNEFGQNARVTFSGLINATFLNAQTVTLLTASPTQFTFSYILGYDYPTKVDTGLATGSAIQNNQSVIVAYNKFALYERLTYVPGETQVLNGTLPTTLDNNGLVNNTWLPASYSSSQSWTPSSITDPFLLLILDGWDGLYGADGGLDVVGSTGLVGAQIPYASRYIKVTYNNGVTDVVKKEGIDFTLTVDPVSGAATVARILTGTIPDGGSVKVSYFYAEPFDFSTQYPAYVQVLVNKLATTKHAAADALVKAMTANPIDITLAVTLDANTAPEAVDSTIRTVINIVLDNAVGTLYQSELVGQIQAITGVQSVQIPLIKCAKSDGSYDIGVVIPTGTSWMPLGSDPAFLGLTVPQNSWITVSSVLPDSTLPSGGQPLAVVNFLYEGQIFRRATSVQDFLTNSAPAAHLASTATPGSFYIIGTNDRINSTTPLAPAYWQKVMLVVPQDVVNPGNLSYLCTYQVFNSGGATNITVSPTEYLSNGRITINYVTSAS